MKMDLKRWLRKRKGSFTVLSVLTVLGILITLSSIVIPKIMAGDTVVSDIVLQAETEDKSIALTVKDSNQEDTKIVIPLPEGVTYQSNSNPSIGVTQETVNNQLVIDWVEGQEKQVTLQLEAKEEGNYDFTARTVREGEPVTSSPCSVSVTFSNIEDEKIESPSIEKADQTINEDEKLDELTQDNQPKTFLNSEDKGDKLNTDLIPQNKESLSPYVTLPNDPNIMSIDQYFRDPIGTGPNIEENGKLLVINPNSKSQLGAIWSKDKVSLLSDFAFESYIYLGNSMGSAADGMTFTLTNDDRMSNSPSSVIGSAGMGIGAYSSGSGKPYVRNALSVEFDTYKNNGSSDRIDREVSADNKKHGHIAFVTPKANNNNYSGEHSGITVSPTYLSNGTWRKVTINWNSTQKILSYDLEGVGSASYTVPDINAQFGGNEVYWGFTSSTGGFAQENALAITRIPTKVSSTAELKINDGSYTVNAEAKKNDIISFKNNLSINTSDISPIDLNPKVSIDLPKELSYIPNSVTINDAPINSSNVTVNGTQVIIDVSSYLSESKSIVIELQTILKNNDASTENNLTTHFEYSEKSQFIEKSNAVNITAKKSEKSIHVFYKDIDNLQDIAPSRVITGTIGASYKETPIKINGFVFESDSGNTAGNFEEDSGDIYFYYHKGELRFEYVPDIMSFEDSKISNKTVESTQKDPNWKIIVEDTRLKKNNWRVTAQLLDQFKDSSGQPLKNDVLLFRKGNQSDQWITSTSEVNVFDGTSTETDDLYDVLWPTQEGPLLQVAPGTVKVGKYTGVINWKLIDAPV